jgi:hypothetical protein
MMSATADQRKATARQIMITVFGYVATLIRNREDVATMALHYIASRSPSARRVLLEIARVANANLPEIVAYDVQPGGRAAKVDLI